MLFVYSNFAPDSFTTRAHFACSLESHWPRLCGVPARTSVPCLAKRSTISSLLRVLINCEFNFATVSRGMVAAGFILYALYARGTFEATQRLTLVSDNAEGVSLGMDLTFSGFPIGRVVRISLADDGRARIELEVPRRDARWLRVTSIFTLERGIVGGARIRAFSGNLQDPPLPDGAERPVLRGDTQEEIPRMQAQASGIELKPENVQVSDGLS